VTDIPLPSPFSCRSKPKAWHEARRSHVGASEVAAIMGLDRFNTARTMWLLKTGRTRPEPTNEAMDWGIRAEHVIARRWAKCYMGGLKIRKWRGLSGEHPGFPDVPLVVSPDYYAHDNERAFCLVQIKTASEWAKGWGAEGTDEIPPGYIVQVQAEMACVPWAQWVYVVVQRGSKTLTYVVERHPQMIEIVESAVERFWGYVERDELPRDQDHIPRALLTLKDDFMSPDKAAMVGTEQVYEVLRTFPGAPVHLEISVSDWTNSK